MRKLGALLLAVSMGLVGPVGLRGAEAAALKTEVAAGAKSTAVVATVKATPKPKRLSRAERKAQREQEAARLAEEAARQAAEAKARQEALERETARRAALEELLKQPVELELTCRRAILVDGKTGLVLYNKAADEPWHPASTTKIMSALMILEQGRLEDRTTVSSSATALYGGYHSNWLWPGMSFTIEQLLHILLIESDNASCNTLAEYLDGTQDKFVERMNKRAGEMGLAAHFTTPYGHTAEQHYVTARDLYLIAKACMEYPAFRAIVRKPSYHLSTRDLDVTYRNRNQFVGNDPRVLGVKTGYTSAAQCNLVCYAEEEGKSLYTVVMGSPRRGIDYSYPDSKKLLDYGFKLLKEAEKAGK